MTDFLAAISEGLGIPDEAAPCLITHFEKRTPYLNFEVWGQAGSRKHRRTQGQKVSGSIPGAPVVVQRFRSRNFCPINLEQQDSTVPGGDCTRSL